MVGIKYYIKYTHQYGKKNNWMFLKNYENFALVTPRDVNY